MCTEKCQQTLQNAPFLVGLNFQSEWRKKSDTNFLICSCGNIVICTQASSGLISLPFTNFRLPSSETCFRTRSYFVIHFVSVFSWSFSYRGSMCSIQCIAIECAIKGKPFCGWASYCAKLSMNVVKTTIEKVMSQEWRT